MKITSVNTLWGALPWMWVMIAVGACGMIQTGGPRFRPPPPTPGQDLTTWLEPLGTDGGHEFYVRNDSGLIYRINQVTLTDCKNVQECGAHRLDIILCPGETRQIFASHPYEAPHAMERERVHFNWGYNASSYEPGEPVVGADCPQGVS